MPSTRQQQEQQRRMFTSCDVVVGVGCIGRSIDENWTCWLFLSSIDDYMICRAKYIPYLERCLEALSQVLIDRHSFIGTNLYDAPFVPGFEFIPLCQGRCSMKIKSYYQPFVYCISLLLLAFPQMSLMETVSILMSIGRSMYSASFLSIAIHMLIAMKPKTKDKG